MRENWECWQKILGREGEETKYEGKDLKGI